MNLSTYSLILAQRMAVGCLNIGKRYIGEQVISVCNSFIHVVLWSVQSMKIIIMIFLEN